MSRIRTIKPEFQQSESMGRVSRDARLLFIQLWTQVDDLGRSRASSRMLASLLFPFDDDAPRLIEGWLAELEREGCILRYIAEGSTYLQVQNFGKHQKIDHPSPSKLPPPPDKTESLARIREDSRDLAPDLVPSTLDLVPIRDATHPSSSGDDPNAAILELKEVRKAKQAERAESDQKLLDGITDQWNQWASRHGCPQVRFLTGQRAIHCRRRIEDLRAVDPDPTQAFDAVLSKCEKSFFVRGSPRSPLKFNQLMKEGFLVQMMEGSFDYVERKDVSPWRR